MLTNAQLLAAYETGQLNDGTLIDSLRAVADIAAWDRQRCISDHLERLAIRYLSDAVKEHHKENHDSGHALQILADEAKSMASFVRAFKEDEGGK